MATLAGRPLSATQQRRGDASRSRGSTTGSRGVGVGVGGSSNGSGGSGNGIADAATAATARSTRVPTANDLQTMSFDNDEDFERLLTSYDVPNVMDALRRYLAMEVQSSLVGATSKQQSAQVKRKFYERFNQILDRIFGNDEVSKHKYGGWLDYSLGVATAALGGTPAGSASSASQRQKRLAAAALGPMSPEQDELLRMERYVESLNGSGRALTEFLGFVREEEAGSMFTLLFKMTHPVEFKMELEMLPEQSKMSIMNRSVFTSVLFTQLLQKPLTKQRLDPRNPVLLVSIKELYLFYFLRHPASANHQPGPTTGDAANSDNKPRSSSLMGSLSDTFARPKRRTDHSWRSFFSEGVASLTKGNPYNVLLLQYLQLFFPDSTRPVQSRFRGKILQHSNLFLHIMIEFWLRQNLIQFSDTSAPPGFMDMGLYRTQQKLVNPLGTVHTQTTYKAPSDDLLSSLVMTIIYLLSDSFYPAAIEDTSTSTGYYSGMAMGSGGGYLTPSVSVLRRPLYEFLRLVFSRAPIGLSPTAFYAITDVWLAYIQPWNCPVWMQSQSASGSMRRITSDGSGQENGDCSSFVYTPVWETYVLANYHFYTTLLGGFVERAKELDFTGADEKAILLLDRVLGIFNPELLSLLRLAADHLNKGQPYAVSSTMYTHRTSKAKSVDREGLSPTQAQILTYYSKSLGIELVGVALHASYHRDAERLFDKLWSDSGFSGTENNPIPARSPRSSTSTQPSSPGSSSWFSQPGETAFERIHRISRQLRRVFEISDAYVASTAHSRSHQSSAANGWESLEPSRNLKLRHLLTREGIQQLRTGLRLCSPDEVAYIGDPMLRPICSYEVPILVRLSYRVSTWLNRRLGLRNPYSGKRFEDNALVDPSSGFAMFRFNFRFLASKPNLAFLGLFITFVYLVLLL